eukprot:352079-Chlamydomonas_euryale.AAC.2
MYADKETGLAGRQGGGFGRETWRRAWQEGSKTREAGRGGGRPLKRWCKTGERGCSSGCARGVHGRVCVAVLATRTVGGLWGNMQLRVRLADNDSGRVVLWRSAKLHATSLPLSGAADAATAIHTWAVCNPSKAVLLLLLPPCFVVDDERISQVVVSNLLRKCKYKGALGGRAVGGVVKCDSVRG